MAITSKGIKELFKFWDRIMTANKDFLIEIDSIVGDGDLGLTMSDGFKAAYSAVESSRETDIGMLLYIAGKAMSSTVPSTMGTLMATGLMQAGKALKGREELQLTDIAELFEEYMQGVAKRGKAKRGEKTFIDGIAPAVDSLKADAAAGETMLKAALNAAAAAKYGYESTCTMVAVHGRAATRGEKSRQLLDPGAAVAMLIMNAFVQYIEMI